MMGETLGGVPWLNYLTKLLPNDFRRMQGEMVTELDRIVTAESPSANPDKLASAAEVLVEMGLRLLGSEPRRLPGDACEHLLWSFGGPGRILIIGSIGSIGSAFRKRFDGGPPRP
jgi:hypothetical protein